MNYHEVTLHAEGPHGSGKTLLLKVIQKMLSARGIRSKLDTSNNEHRLDIDIEDRDRENLANILKPRK